MDWRHAMLRVESSLLWIQLLAVSGALAAPRLRVMSVTPMVDSARRSLEAPSEVALSGRQAITVTFNRAFIALGSDYGTGPLPSSLQPIELEPSVPGHMRWVTTSVIRFDPSEDWPAELHLKLSLRAGLTGYDGASVDEGSQQEWRFKTPYLHMNIDTVHSKRAKNLTAGRWASGSPPEVPPDGIVQLHFTSDVELEFVQRSLQLHQAGHKHHGDAGVSFKLGECNTGPSPRTVCLTPSDTLQVDRKYELVLPIGSRFHKHGGLTQKETTVPLQGLRGFSFQLQSTQPDKDTWFRPQYRRMRLWLQHGLQDGIDMVSLSRQFSLIPAMHFTVTRPERAVLELEAEFQPDTEYKLTIAASEEVCDGFGLPLQASSGLFRTAALQSFFLEPGASDYFVHDAMLSPGGASEAGALSRWPILARGRRLCEGQNSWTAQLDCKEGRPRHIEVVAVREGDVPKAIASIRNQRDVFVQSSDTARLEAPLHDEATVLHMPLEESMKPSGLVLHSRWTSNRYHPKVSSLLGAPSLVAAFVTTSDGMLTVWVLRAEDNSVVAHAKVTAFGYTCWAKCQPSDVTTVAVGVTDENGVAHLQIGPSNQQLAVLVVKQGEPLLLHTEVPHASQPPPDFFKGQIISDRGVYKPLDIVMLKGYVRLQAGEKLLNPSSVNRHSLTVRWTSGGERVTVPLSLDSEFGSFNASLTVPAGAQYGNHLIELEQASPPQYEHLRTISTVPVTVADPRPPTVSLEVKANKPFVPPDGELPLTITTSTLSGVHMANATVKLTWRLQNWKSTKWWAGASQDQEQDESSKKKLTGTHNFCTGDNGSAEVSWRLPRNLSARVGDSIDMSFEWIGPTRELLAQHFVVPVAHSDWSLQLSVPAHRDTLPGLPLSIEAALHRRVDLAGTVQLVKDVPLYISLYRVSDDEAHAADEVMDGGPELLPHHSAKSQHCQTEDSEPANGRLSCEFELPAMGRYLVTACTGQDDRFLPLCSAVPVGGTAAEWEKRPLADFLQQAVSRVSPDRQTYRAGDVPQLVFHNPLPGLRAFLKWGNRLSFRSIVTPRLSAGPARVHLQPLGEECHGGCQVWILFCAPSNSTRELLVPTSPLFHLQGPQSATHTLSLDVVPEKAKELSVSIRPDRAVQEPGSRAGFTVSLEHADGSPADGEVSIFAVDQAFLNLQRHEPVNLSQTLQLDTRGAQLDHRFSHANFVSADGLRFSANALMKLLHADPWLLDSSTEWPVRPTQGSLEQLSLEDMLRDHTFDLTEIPWPSAGFLRGNLIRARGAPLFLAKSAAPVAEMSMAESAVAPAMADEEDSNSHRRSSSGGSAGARRTPKAMPVRENFIVTPLFLPTLHVQGRAHVEWTLPDNIGSFELRAYAVNTNHQFGGGSTTQQVVRRPVSMTPSVPRIVRVGDTFKSGIILTAAPDQVSSRTLQVEMRMHGSAVSLATEAAWDRVHVKAGQTVEVAFAMHATSLGNVTLEVSASDASGGLLDALRMELVVLGVQPEVQVATSFAIVASPPPALPWYEGLVLPASAKGSGHLSVVAGAGREAAVQNLAAAMLRTWEMDSLQDHSANSALCVVATAAVLNLYADAPASKNFRDAQKKLAPATQELAKLTSSKGLHYSAASLASTTDHCDLLLNAFALYILRRLRLANVQMPSTLESLEKIWRNALDLGLQEYAFRRLQQKPYTFDDFDVLAASRLALGSQWQPTNLASLRQVETHNLRAALSIERLLDNVDSLSIFSKASLGLLLVLPGEPVQDKGAALLKGSLVDMPDATRSILEYLTSSLRVTARTAYVAQSLGSQHAASSSANSMALSAIAMSMHMAAEKLPFIAGTDKLASYVAQGTDSPAGAGSVSLLYMALGLVDYDLASGNTDADLDFVAFAGSEQLLTMRVDAAGDKAPSVFETPWDELPIPPPPLLFKAEGVGEMCVAVTLRFVPPVQMGHSAPVYRGIDVQKIVQLYDAMLGSPRGPPLDATTLGNIVTVTLQVTTTDDLHGVSIEDWLPAGLEALDPNLNSVHISVRERKSGCLWYFCPVFHSETKKDRVTFYSSWLYAGTHTVTYQAVAATLGSFVLPSGRASATLQPEIMGMSTGGQFHVRSSDEQLATRSSPGLPVPKRCPHDCMGRGECDTTNGKCNCNPGSSGIDCSSEAPLPVMQPFVGPSGKILDALKFVIGATREVELLVELAEESTQKPLLPTWLFANSSDFLAAGSHGAGNQLDRPGVGTRAGNHSDSAEVTLAAPNPIHLQVVPSKRQVVLVLPEQAPRALTANITVTASADGRLFASRQLAVQLYPHCIPGSRRACDCDHLPGELNSGEQLCSAAGTWGMCSCLDPSQSAPPDDQLGATAVKAPEAQANDSGLPWAIYILLGLCALIAWPCYKVGWRRICWHFKQVEEGAPLFGRGAEQETELAPRSDSASLLRSRSPAAATDYWNVADVAE